MAGRVVVLSVLGLLLLAVACLSTPRAGVYLALKYTYYPESLEPLTSTRLGRGLRQVYPELGVFDPHVGTLSDFQRSFLARADALPPEPGPEAALQDLPRRIERAFRQRVQVIGWVYLHRASRPGIPQKTLPSSTEPPGFEPHDPAHRAALIRTLLALRDRGFDGVQLDLEPFLLEDIPPMRMLLQEIEQQLGGDFFRSVFTPKVVAGGEDDAIHAGFAWSEPTAFGALAKDCEQLVVPLYDYGALVRSEAQYAARVQEALQTLLPLRALQGKLTFALPAYRETPQHGPAERLEVARRALGPVSSRLGFVLFLYSGAPEDLQPEEVWKAN